MPQPTPTPLSPAEATAKEAHQRPRHDRVAGRTDPAVDLAVGQAGGVHEPGLDADADERVAERCLDRAPQRHAAEHGERARDVAPAAGQQGRRRVELVAWVVAEGEAPLDAGLVV